MNPSRAFLLKAETEREWQARVRGWAALGGWKVHCVYDSRRSPDGWPDLFMVRGEHAIAAELKRDNGRLTAAQTDWLYGLSRVPGIECYVWRPSDEDAVKQLLLPRGWAA